MLSLAKLYYASSPGEYSALIMMVEAGEGFVIGNVYGSFDPAVLGGSFNVPPAAGAAPIVSAEFNGEVTISHDSRDMTLMQMTAYRGDAAGQAFFSRPDGPPACQTFNYCIMVMGVQGSTFSIKPRGWKTGDHIPFTFDVSKMTRLELTDLSNAQAWCKAKEPISSENAPLMTLSSGESKNGSGWLVALFVVLALVVLGVMVAKK
jgi:hypothetical protein